MVFSPSKCTANHFDCFHFSFIFLNPNNSVLYVGCCNQIQAPKQPQNFELLLVITGEDNMQANCVHTENVVVLVPQHTRNDANRRPLLNQSEALTSLWMIWNGHYSLVGVRLFVWTVHYVCECLNADMCVVYDVLLFTLFWTTLSCRLYF